MNAFLTGALETFNAKEETKYKAKLEDEQLDKNWASKAKHEKEMLETKYRMEREAKQQEFKDFAKGLGIPVDGDITEVTGGQPTSLADVIRNSPQFQKDFGEYMDSPFAEQAARAGSIEKYNEIKTEAYKFFNSEGYRAVKEDRASDNKDKADLEFEQDQLGKEVQRVYPDKKDPFALADKEEGKASKSPYFVHTVRPSVAGGLSKGAGSDLHADARARFDSTIQKIEPYIEQEGNPGTFTQPASIVYRNVRDLAAAVNTLKVLEDPNTPKEIKKEITPAMVDSALQAIERTENYFDNEVFQGTGILNKAMDDIFYGQGGAQLYKKYAGQRQRTVAGSMENSLGESTGSSGVSLPSGKSLDTLSVGDRLTDPSSGKEYIIRTKEQLNQFKKAIKNKAVNVKN